MLALWLGLFLAFAGGSCIYFAYVRFYATKPWKIRIDKDFQPAVTVLIPVHNEQKIIKSKLENISTVSYPREKIEVILADDGSTDGTLEKVYSFSKTYPNLKIKVVRQNSRVGKAVVLNAALPASTNDIIVVSDADTFWPSDIFQKALPYLSGPMIGAITGSGVLENPRESWVTKGEVCYLKSMSLLRLGESKIHSTIRFEGGFCAYKRSAFQKFDCESGSDDSGTALSVVQNGFRTIFVPEARFVTKFPERLEGKIKVKIRRASHLTLLWIKSLTLLLNGRLLLPKRIAIPEIFLFIFNPIVFVALLTITLATVIIYPILFILLVVVLFAASLIPTVRSYLIEIALDNIIIFYSLISCVKRKKIVAWEKN